MVALLILAIVGFIGALIVTSRGGPGDEVLPEETVASVENLIPTESPFNEPTPEITQAPTGEPTEEPVEEPTEEPADMTTEEPEQPQFEDEFERAMKNRVYGSRSQDNQ